MSQTVIDDTLAVGLEGQKADSGFDDVLSRIAEGAVPFGKLVVVGTDPDKQGQLPSTTGEITTASGILGVSIHSHDNQFTAVGEGNANEDAMNLMHKGRVYVKVEEAVTPASPVFARYAAGGDGLGSFRASDPGTAADQVPGARYLSSAGIGELALLEVDL